MGDPLEHGRIRVLLLDIEGTTTALDFVTQVLFPFARARAREFLTRRAADAGVQADLAGLRSERESDQRAGNSPPPWHGGSSSMAVDSAVAYIHWLMDRDRKSTSLKSLQGRIWEEGYREGRLVGQVYADVPWSLARWRAQGREAAIFSSGSVLAQRLLFCHSEAGDLTPYIGAYFDTTTGGKSDPQSYLEIARALGRSPQAVLFLSDVTAEVDAARTAGMATALCVRKGDPPPAPGHLVVRSFDEVLP